MQYTMACRSRSDRDCHDNTIETLIYNILPRYSVAIIAMGEGGGGG